MSAKKTSNERGDFAQPAQDRFLNQLIKEHRKVAIFLINGIRIEAQIVSFDEYVILIKNAMTGQVYKHAVSTIQPITGAGLEVDVKARKETSRLPTIIRRRKPGMFKGGADGG